MPRALKTLAAVLLIALMPLRAVAAVTVGFCASNHQERAAAVQTGHAHGAGAHAYHGKGSPVQPVEPSCNVCAEHCSSAAFAPSVAALVGPRPLGLDRLPHAEAGAPAFFTDQLDRPPLA